MSKEIPWDKVERPIVEYHKDGLRHSGIECGRFVPETEARELWEMSQWALNSIHNISQGSINLETGRVKFIDDLQNENTRLRAALAEYAHESDWTLEFKNENKSKWSINTSPNAKPWEIAQRAQDEKKKE